MSSSRDHIKSTQTTPHNFSGSSLFANGLHRGPSRSRTPNVHLEQSNASRTGIAPETEPIAEDDAKTTLFKTLYAQSETRLSALFNEQLSSSIDKIGGAGPQGLHGKHVGEGEHEQLRGSVKKVGRIIDEDDYDDSEDEDEESTANISPLKSKSTGVSTVPRVSSPQKVSGIPPSPALSGVHGLASGKTSDDARRRLEEDKKAIEDAAKRDFQTLFYPIDNDRDAMIEQQKLEESDRQVDVEMSGQGTAIATTAIEGTLSQANLGASSLVLKHLIARIDAKRDQVQASDQELRNLMIEVKKNRSKWYSEDKVGQEELYEAAEKVLSEVKAITEHSQPFLQRVNKRDAPDYYNKIKHPMDLSTMTKKLKAVQYKSKQEFVGDLNLIWQNCLTYNTDPAHFLRRHAVFMRKETEKLVPLIPDIIIRDRAEVEAEERRHNAEGDIDGAEDSDDEPIISSRGRKAPGKKAKKGTTTRKAPTGAIEGTPGAESKPPIHGLMPNGTGTILRHDILRADSDTAMEGSQNGLSTPPPGTVTPAGLNGVTASAAVSSQVDSMEVDVYGNSTNGTGPLGGNQNDYEDPEYKIWKQVTKRDRALVTAERHKLFYGDRINAEEPALLRTKAGMKRWLRQQREAEVDRVLGKRKRDGDDDEDSGPSGETLAEGMEGAMERVLPDYYDTMAAIPDISKQLQWLEDSDGQIAPASEVLLRIVPSGIFTAPESVLTKKLAANLRQMQETRKVCTKIGVVRQMQLQSQMYQNQFQKYDPEPFMEKDIEPHVVSDSGPVMANSVCRAAMQRSVGKIFYNAGFEEYQPSALEAITDLASDYFSKLASSLADYMQKPKITLAIATPGTTEPKVEWQAKHTIEECALQCLQDNGIELESLESYVKEDVDRLTGKLGNLHDRMKSHLADLLRPALAADAGPDGVNAFNDGSEQFIGGDFAEDLDEDFFGFKDLGLDKEFGLMSLSVPLHLLQNRMHNAYQAQNISAIITTSTTFPPPLPYPPVTVETIRQEIGLVQNFYLAKLHANGDAPLVEDEDLPQKQRFPKPRLPPTGKISSPRKKPVREPGPGKGHPKKKMRMVEGEGWVRDVEADRREREKSEKEGKGISKNVVAGKATAKGKLGIADGIAIMERDESRDADGDPEEEEDGAKVNGLDRHNTKEKMNSAMKVNGINGNSNSNDGGMMSPESLEAI
ncbi:Transcriptional activator spt7 [Xylographa trunciseda]|nr:Transcriptional activator spt7 [Xylographa trunciseda]